MANPKLCQIVAVFKGLESRTLKSISGVYQTLPKADLYSGLARTYTPKDEDGEHYPDEGVLVQRSAENDLTEATEQLTRLFDAALTRDVGNTKAVGAVKVNGQALFEAPIPFLLFLDKQLVHLRTMVAKLPVVDPTFVWYEDGSTGQLRTEPVKTNKTKKVPRVLTKAEATDKHPAQTEVWWEDVTVGRWDTTKLSGAVRQIRKTELLQRIDTLADAVKHAVEAANQIEVEQLEIGDTLFDYLLAR